MYTISPRVATTTSVGQKNCTPIHGHNSAIIQFFLAHPVFPTREASRACVVRSFWCVHEFVFVRALNGKRLRQYFTRCDDTFEVLW